MIDYIGPETKLVVRKRVQAAPALVFRAFTEAALIEQWFCPSADASVRVDMLEVREGAEGDREKLKTIVRQTATTDAIKRLLPAR